MRQAYGMICCTAALRLPSGGATGPSTSAARPSSGVECLALLPPNRVQTKRLPPRAPMMSKACGQLADGVTAAWTPEAEAHH
ncbi:hypothetical protein NDU88_007741 [Pleurodeles waltl]|uniref:Secreted protein n=1 Tax=Pleurodeles waltl TaxID=8319 RepID=A0AAV7STP3_PLEWA|nr:hypothetical protein NDU88_007741 [Pleurodeles waltl]